MNLQPPFKAHANALHPGKTPKAADVIKATDSKEKSPESIEPVRGENGWLAKTRQQLAQVATEIKADLDFHEQEGVQAFAPDAPEQVEALRGDMNGPAGITR